MKDKFFSFFYSIFNDETFDNQFLETLLLTIEKALRFGEENDILVVAGNADYELIISNDIYGQPHCTLYGSMQSAADIE